MDREVYATALKNALDEIRNICPDVRCSFLFTKDNTVIASDGEAQETAIEEAVRSFSDVFERASAIGGLRSVLINGNKGKTYLLHVNDTYLTVVADAETDMKYLRTVTHVIIPTVLKMLESLAPTLLKQTAPEEKLTPPTGEFTVEVMSGLFVRRDTVQIDPEILSAWSEKFDGKDIDMVEIETCGETTLRCRVRAIKDFRFIGKGIVRVPEKICKTLDLKEGETVKIKPLIS